MMPVMEIDVLVDEAFEGKVSADWLKGVARLVLEAEGADPTAAMSLVITGQDEIRQLNAVHLGEDEPTDVLAFPLQPDEDEEDGFILPPDGAVHLGEVIISYPQAEIQAGERGHPVQRELAVLLVHGVLHLLGYDHDTPEREARMKAREAALLARLEAVP